MPGLVAGLVDGFDDDFQGLFVGFQVGGEAAFVADGGVVPLGLEDALEGVEDLGAHAQRLGEAGGAGRHDHEFLDVDVVVGVGAAVDDVHHRQGQYAGVGPADVLVERQAGFFGGGLGHGQRDAQDGVGAQLALVFGAVQLDHAHVDADLVDGVHADQVFGDDVVDVVDGLEDALAEVALLVAVAQLHGLALAGGCAGRHGGAAEGARLQIDFHLQGRIAAGIKDLSGIDIYDLTHYCPLARNGYGGRLNLRNNSDFL